MHLRRLVGAVLGPHRRVHRELVVVRIAAEGRADLLELVVCQAELSVDRLRGAHAARARAIDNSEANIGWPPVAPTSGSTACSGCGISPTTLPASLRIPAIAFDAPLGLASSPRSPAGVQ